MVVVVAVEPSHDVTVRTSVVHRLIPPVHILIIPEAFRGRVVGNMAEYKYTDINYIIMKTISP